MSERCTKHTRYERFVKHFWQINRNDENVYICYFSLLSLLLLFLFLLLLLLSLLFSSMLSLSALFLMEQGCGRAWRSGSSPAMLKKTANGGSHEVDENKGNAYIYICIFYSFIHLFIYLCIYLYIYLFIYLFIYSFFLLKY